TLRTLFRLFTTGRRVRELCLLLLLTLVSGCTGGYALQFAHEPDHIAGVAARCRVGRLPWRLTR
ncbi:MAG TPA: hypothetical protein VM364_23235, partial [Vicinamibacterales bacterium]|nr:hypothetical protein [Vicinamibacterales bacterium]